MISAFEARKNANLASPKQVARLAMAGIDRPHLLTFKAASELLDSLTSAKH